MDVNQLIEETFLETDRDLEAALDGLSTAELEWRPTDEANSIGFTLWHQTRAEDIWVNDFAQKAREVFSRDGRASKWNIPVQDTGARYTKEQLGAFVTPPVAEMWQYNRAVRAETLKYLGSLNAQDFEFTPQTDNPRRRGYTIGRMFGHLLCEVSQHVGHIRYLRGLQRGLNK